MSSFIQARFIWRKRQELVYLKGFTMFKTSGNTIYFERFYSSALTSMAEYDIIELSALQLETGDQISSNIGIDAFLRIVTSVIGFGTIRLSAKVQPAVGVRKMIDGIAEHKFT